MNAFPKPVLLAAEQAATLEIDDLPAPCMEIDARGIITRVNRALLALHDPRQGELIGRSAWDLMAMDEKYFSVAAFLSAMASGDDPPAIARSLFDRSGAFRTYEMHRSLIRDRAGRPVGMRMICVDVTDARKALDDALRTVRWLTSAVRSMTQAVILCDALGSICSMNPAAEELTGWRARDLTGKAIEEVLPPQPFPPRGSKMLDHRTMLERPCRGNVSLLTRERNEVGIELNTSPIVDEVSGSVTGVVALLRQVECGV
ncbi:MAG: PAS domain-containing protein [Terracidiphilus sp.]|jgi:PAS domain S-box-containing protein